MPELSHLTNRTTESLSWRKFGLTGQPIRIGLSISGRPVGYGLTGVCINEIIATNRPRHTWIPTYPGMTEWA